MYTNRQNGKRKMNEKKRKGTGDFQGGLLFNSSRSVPADNLFKYLSKDGIFKIGKICQEGAVMFSVVSASPEPPDEGAQKGYYSDTNENNS